jgi:hypothetical protein
MERLKVSNMEQTEFVVIEMNAALTREELIENALVRLKRFNVIQYLYYILAHYFIFLQKLSTIFEANTILVVDTTIFKKIKGTFTIKMYHNVLLFKNNESQLEFILPYEYIIRFGILNSLVVNMEIFATFADDTIKLSDNRINVYIEVESPRHFVSKLHNYLMYHMKYNKIRVNVVDYYLNAR